jgi:hypothetical protein
MRLDSSKLSAREVAMRDQAIANSKKSQAGGLGVVFRSVMGQFSYTRLFREILQNRQETNVSQ